MADVKDFKLPDLGEGLTEGEIVTWRVKQGDVIDLNAVVAEVETAKAIVEVPSPYAGTVVETIGAEGETLEVGSVFVRIDISSDLAVTDAVPEIPANGSTGLDADTEPQPLVGYGSKGSSGSRRRRRGAPKAAAVATAPAAGQVPAPVAHAPQTTQTTPSTSTNGSSGSGAQVLAKPPVRKLAKTLGVDLATCLPGAGPKGSITREQVQAAASGTGHAATAAMPTGGSALPAGAGFRGMSPGDTIRIGAIRKRIAQKMTESRTTIPEATTSTTVDVTRLWELRAELNSAAESRGLQPIITPFSLIMRAAVVALREYPTLNARMDEEAGEIKLLEEINLGFAADTDRGLVVPVVHGARDMGVYELSSAIRELALKARDGRIAPGDMMGGTFTISNYGAFGNDTGNPVINHPEAAIMGVGVMDKRPWVVDDQIAIRRVCTFTVAFDHRICDGGEAGRFITRVAQLAAAPGGLLL